MDKTKMWSMIGTGCTLLMFAAQIVASVASSRQSEAMLKDVVSKEVDAQLKAKAV